ncbi:hypothetical protein D3C71_1676660 [compost metagenome]
MEFMDVRAQRFRAHAEEHPFDFIGKLAHHLGDDFQVTGMAGATAPPHPWLARGAALAA